MLESTVAIEAPDITLKGASGHRDSVVIQGDAMSHNAGVHELVRVAAARFTLRSLTLQRSGTQLLQVAGEANANQIVVRDVVLRDSWEQMLKASSDPTRRQISADGGLVEDSLFEYSAHKRPQFYIGGIDAHAGRDWIVRRNTFRGIVSPTSEVAEFAIHFWSGTEDAVVEQNTILDCDRGIGFGLAGRGNQRGIIRGNTIFTAAGVGPAQDTGIHLDSSPGTQVLDSSVFIFGACPYANEYRAPSATGVLIANNITNKPIVARDGAKGVVQDNVLRDTLAR